MDEDAEFSKFWETYPKKKSKGDAYRAWCAEKKNRPSLQTVLKALVVLKDSDDWTKDGGQYVPYPATWIRAWGWADVAEDAKQDVVDGQFWWKSVRGINAKAKEINLEWDAVNGETFQQFTARVKEESQKRKVVPLAANGS